MTDGRVLLWRGTEEVAHEGGGRVGGREGKAVERHLLHGKDGDGRVIWRTDAWSEIEVFSIQPWTKKKNPAYNLVLRLGTKLLESKLDLLSLESAQLGVSDLPITSTTKLPGLGTLPPFLSLWFFSLWFGRLLLPRTIRMKWEFRYSWSRLLQHKEVEVLVKKPSAIYVDSNAQREASSPSERISSSTNLKSFFSLGV
jgi:hypothetical protein